MMETIGPAVCGSKSRTALALTCFAIGAVGVAAAVGLALGLIGSPALLPLAIGVAIAGALREAGFVRLPLPQLRRQVPERWHHELPLPIWAAGYGAGLGAGLLTFQPVATFIVVAVAAAASGPTAAALALAAFGVGRALAAALPGRFIERMAGLLVGMRRANALTLALVALVLVVAPAGAAPLDLGAGSQLDPAVGDDGALAFSQRNDDGTTAVVIHPRSGAPIVIAGASEPSLRDEYLAVRDAAGIVVTRWATGEIVGRLDGAWSKPALAWPFIVGVLDRGSRRRLVVVDLRTRKGRQIDVVNQGDDLGRPSIDRHYVVWHQATRTASRIRLADIRTFRTSTIRRSRRVLVSNPSLRRGTVVWVEQSLGVSRLMQRRFSGGRIRARRLVRSPRLYWTTAIGPGGVYVTTWNTALGRAQIERIR